MMKLIYILAVIGFVAFTGRAQENTGSKRSDDKNPGRNPDSLDSYNIELRRSVDEFKNAYNRMDTATLATFYKEDAHYVSPHVPDLLICGRDRIKENWHRGMAMGGHIDTVEVLTTGSSCDLAYIVSKYEATNSGAKVSGRNVLIMKRINGKWLITTHASVVRD